MRSGWGVFASVFASSFELRGEQYLDGLQSHPVKRCRTSTDTMKYRHDHTHEATGSVERTAHSWGRELELIGNARAA